jgi:hypothetical protein
MVRESTLDQGTTLGGDGWTKRSPKWVGNREAPTIEEVDGVGCFDSWRLTAPRLVMGLTDAWRWRLGARQQLMARGTARQWQRQQQQAKQEHVMEQSGSECARRKNIFCLSRVVVGDKGTGTGAHGCGSVNRGATGLWVEAVKQCGGLGALTVHARERRRFGRWARAYSSWGGLVPLNAQLRHFQFLGIFQLISMH